MYAKRFGSLWSSAAAVVFAGCATLQVRTDYDQRASFTPLSTYEWVDQEAYNGGNPADNGGNPAYNGRNLAVNSPFLARHIRESVDDELGRMGYSKAESGTPDFRIAYRVIAQERARANSYGYGGGYGYSSYHPGFYGFRFYRSRYFRPYYGYGYSGGGYGGGGYVREYLRGTLVLDIIDVRKDELIWRGWGTKSLDADPRPEKVRMYVDEAVAEILEEFPPTS